MIQLPPLPVAISMTEFCYFCKREPAVETCSICKRKVCIQCGDNHNCYKRD